jgi:hypothetical protein
MVSPTRKSSRTDMKDIQTIQALQLAIARSVIAEVDPGWDIAVVNYRQVATTGEGSLITRTAGASRVHRFPFTAMRGFLQLRQSMATTEHGAWYSAVLTITAHGDLDFEFDYEREPTWNVPRERSEYIEDLRLFPRKSDEIPPWHPARKSDETEPVS